MSIPARRSAKAKTAVQAVAVGLALAPIAARRAPWLARVTLWAAVALTLGSGAQYLRDGTRAARRGCDVDPALDEMGEAGARAG